MRVQNCIGVRRVLVAFGCDEGPTGDLPVDEPALQLSRDEFVPGGSMAKMTVFGV